MKILWTVSPFPGKAIGRDPAGNVYTLEHETNRITCCTTDGRGGAGDTALEALRDANRAKPTQPELFPREVMPWNLQFSEKKP
jgi:hypothetical protein